MANGYGGRRTGAGRKPKPAWLRALDGGAGHRPIPPEILTPAEIEEFDAPDTLTMEERHVWLKQAPSAFKARTLTRATAMSFERYCRIVVLEQREAASSGLGGANHRGLLKQINAYELQFMLTPNGKPIYEAPPAEQVPANPLEKFLNRKRG